MPRYVMRRCVLLLFICLFVATAARAGLSPAHIPPDFSHVDLTPNIEVLEDKDGRLTIADLINRPELPFRAINAKHLNLGYSRSAYWVRLRTANTGTQSLDWFLEYGQTYAHTVELYQPTPRGYQQVATGNARPYDTRPYDALTFVFPIHQAPGVSTYYIHLKSYNRITLLFQAWSQAALNGQQLREYILLWFFYAFMLAMILYNFVLFFFIRERSYILYVLFQFANLLFVMSFDGTGFKYLWPQAVGWESMALMVLLVMQNVSAMIFYQSFLRLKEYSTRAQTFLNVLIVLDLLMMAVKIAQPQLPVAQYLQPVLLVSALGMIAIATQLYRKGSRPAVYFLIAFIIILSFAVLNSLISLLSLPQSTFIHYGMHAGTAIMAVLLSLGLADKINTMRIANQEGETQYRTLFESANDAILILEGGTIVNCNYKAQEIFLCGRMDLVGQEIAGFLSHQHSDPANSVQRLEDVANRLTLTHPEQLEWELCRRDGTPFAAEISLNRLELQGKQLIQALIRDISERKRFMDALKTSEEKFSKSFRGAPQVMIITTRDEGRIIDVNDTFVEITGYERHDVLGRTTIELGAYQNPIDRAHIMERLRSGKPVRNYEIQMQAKSGRIVPMLMSVESMDIGDQSCLLAILSDISERKRAEEDLKASEEARLNLQAQLAQAQKMESIGRLAGGVAHDFNNLLSVILGYGDLMAASLAKTDTVNHERLQQVLKAGERAKDLTRQLLAFGRKQVLETKPLNLNTLITDFKAMLIRLIGEDIQLKTVQDERIGLVNADASQIEQVLLNLAVNARDAMPHGGTLILETATVTLDDEYALSHMPVIPGTYVVLTFSDTGCGMDGQTISRVFEPFFTTKSTGQGTGLGLAMVYGIVKQHGGYIWVYSEEGIGTSFKIYLPQVQDSGVPQMSPSGPPTALSGTETILVIEDDPEVRRLVVLMLAQSGYTVIETGSAQEALSLAAEHATIHLVLTDIVMPEMSGRQVYEGIAAFRPDIKVLYMSGYTGDVIAHHGILDAGIHFIQKPFSSQQLSHKIREVLTGGD